MKTEKAKALLEAASPGPWFLNGFDLHDTGTWMIAVMAREGNPSTKSDPKVTAELAVLAPSLLAWAIDAVEALARLHDGADNMNVELCAPGRYCKLCLTAIYNPKEGVVHKEGCAMREARKAVADWEALGAKP